MNDSRLASRYAKALFLLAKERNQVQVVKQDLSKLTGLLAVPPFNALQAVPVLPAPITAALLVSCPVAAALIVPVTT